VNQSKKSIEENEPLFPAQAIAARLTKTRKSITVDDEFIENLLYTRYEDRYAFPILALLYPNLDYKNGDFHKDHIHPKTIFTKSKLKKAGIVSTSNDPDWYFANSDFYNGIVNFAKCWMGIKISHPRTQGQQGHLSGLFCARTRRTFHEHRHKKFTDR